MKFSVLGSMTGRILIASAKLIFSVVLVYAVQGTVHAQKLRLDPTKVEGPDACGECHKASVNAWKPTHHSKSFKTLPRTKEAKKISKKMGLRRIKAGSDCLTCHFTSAMVKNKPKPVAGISCESCHGAGKDWIKEHSNLGGKGVTRETEAPAHRKARYEKSVAAGMIRPSDLYKLANNCFECHTVPNEKLVNVGGHTAGSKFDLVSWSQGELRHNVWYTKSNGEASASRKRMLYIIGKALDLEHALRGVANATKKATYAVSMARRAAAARKTLSKIAGKLQIAEITDMVAAGKAAALKLNNAAQLTAAADKVGAAARKFANSHDGSKLAVIDVLVPGPGTYEGKAVP